MGTLGVRTSGGGDSGGCADKWCTVLSLLWNDKTVRFDYKMEMLLLVGDRLGTAVIVCSSIVRAGNGDISMIWPGVGGIIVSDIGVSTNRWMASR